MGELLEKHKTCNLDYGDSQYAVEAWCTFHEVLVKIPDIEPDLEAGSEFEEALEKD